MSRIEKTFAMLKKKGKKALIPFLTAGDPSLAQTEKLVLTLEKAGADIIELGVPFSDPMADGPVIQAASERALRKKITLKDILRLVGRIRKKTEIPLLLMGYYNPILAMGLGEFSARAKQAGVDGVLVVDLPPEEARPLARALRKNRIDLVMLVAPTSGKERMNKILRIARGFVYYVSLTGVTGAKLSINEEMRSQISRLRHKNRLPVCVGFGISTPDQAKRVALLADGVVIGSSLVRLVGKKGYKRTLYSRVFHFISQIKLSIK